MLLWTRPRVSFYACVDPLFDVQVIYRALTRQLNDRMILYYCLVIKVDRS
jgi:hypothetical protein